MTCTAKCVNVKKATEEVRSRLVSTQIAYMEMFHMDEREALDEAMDFLEDVYSLKFLPEYRAH